MFERRIALWLLALSITVSGCSQPDKATHLRRGDALSAEGKWAESIAEYQKAIEIDKGYGEARTRLADALEESHSTDVQAIRRERLRAAELLPQNNDVQFKAGESLVAARRWDAAALRADVMLKNEPDSWRARLLKASIASGRNDPATAAPLIEQAITLAPNAAEPYVSLGRLRQKDARHDDAEAAFRRAVELAPTMSAAYAGLGDVYWTSGRTVQAEQALKKAIELDPGDVRSLRTLATLYQSAGRIAEAEAPLRAWANRRNDMPAQMTLADYYIRANRFDEAQTVLSAASAAGNADAVLRLAEVAFRRGDKAEAHRQVDALLATDGRYVGALVLKARLLMYEGKLDEALGRALEAIKTDPQFPDAHFVLGTIQTERHDVNAAMEAFTRVTWLTRESQSRAAQDELVGLRLQQDSEAALDRAIPVVGRNPDRAAPSLALSRSLLQHGDLRRAESVLTGLVSEHENVAAVHAQLGRLRTLQGRLAEARQAFNRALALNPRSAEAFRGRVDVELKDKNTAAARAMVDERLTQVKSVSDLLFAARIYEAVGDVRQADTVLRQVLDMNSDSEAAMKSLVRLAAEQGRLESMRVEYDALARSQPSSLVAPTMLGLIFEEQDKRADAEQVFEQVLARAPAAPVAMVSLARLYASAGKDRLGAAFDLAWRAKLLMPDSPEVAAVLGWIYYRQGNAPLAIPQFESAVSEAPANVLFRYRLGLAYALAGDRTKALAAVEQALRLKPDYPQALKTRADIRQGRVAGP